MPIKEFFGTKGCLAPVRMLDVSICLTHESIVVDIIVVNFPGLAHAWIQSRKKMMSHPVLFPLR
jgi:hypothetical protein